MKKQNAFYALSVCIVGFLMWLIGLSIIGCASTETRLKRIDILLANSEHASEPLPTKYTVIIEQRKNEYGVWKPYMNIGPIASSSPRSGHVFVIVYFDLRNIPKSEVIIKREDITLVDNSGNKLLGNFWAPIKGGVWAGTALKVSKSEVKVVSKASPLTMPIPKEASKETGLISFLPAGPVEITSNLGEYFIQMLFEVPESKIKELKLMFLDRLIGQVSAE